jgi:hypothetical protein
MALKSSRKGRTYQELHGTEPLQDDLTSKSIHSDKIDPTTQHSMPNAI